MDEKLAKQLSEETNKIIDERIEYMYEGYLHVRDAYKNKYRLTQLDSIRHEICICISFGLNQAAITLTNHLLESLLKSALIFHHGRENIKDKNSVKGRIVSSLIDQYKEAREKYGKSNLNFNINRACTLGLISKQDKKKLHEIRERIRNAYGHADKDKLFGNETIEVTGVRFEEDKITSDEISKPKISDLMIGQGVIQVMQAKVIAPDYFLYIDSLVRKLNVDLFKNKKYAV